MTLSSKSIDVQFATAEEIEIDCSSWAVEISAEFIPDLIVFLAKSGYLFAKPLSACFDCEMVDLIVSRPSNDAKDAVSKLIRVIPKLFLADALKSKSMYAYHKAVQDRNLLRTPRFSKIDFSSHKRILIIDDSIDTGWSMLAAIGEVNKVAPDCDLRVASYCVMSECEGRVEPDYWRYRDTIVITATSRYSAEYESFVKEYKEWSSGV